MSDEPRDIEENLQPGTNRFFDARGKEIGTHDQETRRNLALGIFVGLALLYAATFAAYLCGWLDTNHFTAAIAGISGPQAIAAAVAGFYYGTSRRN
jgi:hypothetical protein